MKASTQTLLAGAAEVNITPQQSLHLAGYPFVERNSTGVHDPLLSSALYITDGITPVIFIANDVIFAGKATVARVRKQVAEKTGVPASHIMISATHTHSGPVTVHFVAGSHDPHLPRPDESYLKQLEAGMVEAACRAVDNAVAARVGMAIADATGIGTNRHDPAGASDTDVPVLVARSVQTAQPIAVMLICNMHPTVLHGDSTLYSGDFPGLARKILQEQLLTTACPVLHHIGAAGNQSPRHVTRANTFAEAERLGRILAVAVNKAIDDIQYISDSFIKAEQQFVELPRKSFPAIQTAEAYVQKTRDTLDRLQQEGRSRQAIRTAEVNWFGAVELAYLSRLAHNNGLDETYTACMPAEVQFIHIGDWCFVSWQGEAFIEYWLDIKRRSKNVFLITMANGELQGYIVTKEAFEQGMYEASNAIFDYKSGAILVDATLTALKMGPHAVVFGN